MPVLCPFPPPSFISFDGTDHGLFHPLLAVFNFFAPRFRLLLKLPAVRAIRRLVHEVDLFTHLTPLLTCFGHARSSRGQPPASNSELAEGESEPRLLPALQTLFANYLYGEDHVSSPSCTVPPIALSRLFSSVSSSAVRRIKIFPIFFTIDFADL